MIRVPGVNPSGANAAPAAPFSSSPSASSSSSSSSSSSCSRAPHANGSASGADRARPTAEAPVAEVDDNAVRSAFEQLETTIERASELARKFERTNVDASLRRALTDLFFLDAPSPVKKDRLERSRAWVTALPMEKLRDRTVVARLKDLVRERLEIETRTKRYRARVADYCRGFLTGGDRRSPEADDGRGTPSPSEEGDEVSDEEDANPKGAGKQPASILDGGSDVVSRVFRLMRCGSGAGPVAPPPGRRYVATSRGYVSSGSSDSLDSPPRRTPSILAGDEDPDDSEADDRPLSRKRERTPISAPRTTRTRHEPSSSSYSSSSHSSSSSSAALATRNGTSLLAPLRVDPAPSWDSVVASGTALKQALSRSESFDSTGSWDEASPSSSSRAEAASKGAPPQRKSFVIVQRSTATVARKPTAPLPKPAAPKEDTDDDDDEENESDAEEEAEEETLPRKRARRAAENDDDAEELDSEAGEGDEEEEEDDEDEVDRILAGEDGDDEEEGESTSDRDEDAEEEKEEEEGEKEEEESEFAVLGDDDEEPATNEDGDASDAEDDVKIFGGDESDEEEGEGRVANESDAEEEPGSDDKNEPAAKEKAPSGKEEEGDDDDVRLFGEGEEEKEE